ncbi:zinc finger MYM-type protein 1-like [Aphis gossypii]|uniref:zinc finger MYM-type protein 1-like n=1 Tax=Aphis gossypii TaxID=80765 RepID=UPI00215996C4|nr:zinc finger MYM-type protein 1-like [Aphis gossypii]
MSSVEQFSAVPLQSVENETVLPVENDTNKECDDSIKIMRPSSEHQINVKDTIDIIDDELQLVNEASCSSTMSNVEEYTTGLEIQGVSGPAIDPAKWSISSLKSLLGNLQYGLKNWAKCYDKVQKHEKSPLHCESVRIWYLRTEGAKNNSINTVLKEEMYSKISYWTQVLRRVVSTITFLAERGLSFRGNNSEFGSVHNADKIVYEINESKNFSIIIDSTPDISKTDQLTVVIRYITATGKSKERFLAFLPSVGHKGEQMEYALIKKFNELGIELKNCRGQSYDNASNMSGVYKGLQARIKKWELLKNIIDKSPSKSTSVPKNLCITRWSSRHEACKGILSGYKEILEVLKILSEDITQTPSIRNEANSIRKK